MLSYQDYLRIAKANEAIVLVASVLLLLVFCYGYMLALQ